MRAKARPLTIGMPIVSKYRGVAMSQLAHSFVAASSGVWPSNWNGELRPVVPVPGGRWNGAAEVTPGSRSTASTARS